MKRIRFLTGSDTKTIIANRVKELRTIACWTQIELADASKLSRATIVAIEGALADPTIDTLSSIADALGVSVRDFF